MQRRTWLKLGLTSAAVGRALLSMMESQFSAGAKQLFPLHEMAGPSTSWAQARAALMALPMKPRLVKIVSVPVTGRAVTLA